ncbi:TetR/AcrR family transcriptional regulator [Nocardia sp. NPDC057663]|uniref:TetR/AcrR family transcriptional regulator n=1 Tax=Nocardia sp. NPDC057663 TaxID=3346201 RepID=UPI00366EDF90
MFQQRTRWLRRVRCGMVGDMATRTGTPERPRARTVSPGRPPKAAVVARWRNILEIAAGEFVEHGYAQANIARIANTAGVSKKTIYARCPSKDDLLIAVVNDLASRSHAATTTAMSECGDNPQQVLTRFGREVAQNWVAPEHLGFYRLIIAEVPRFPQLAAVYRQVMERFGTTLADYLREQCAQGTLSVPDPDAASRQFGMLVYGELRERALLGETVTQQHIEGVVQRAVRVFLVGYSSPQH